MTIYDILVPLSLIVAGAVLTFYSQKAGIAFCRLGKANWKMTTFGLTDMHWFYPEDKAPRTMKLMGVVLCIIGVLIALLSYISLHGPNSFAAMRQADGYLIGIYGKASGETSFTCATSSTEDTVVHYQYGDQKGNLRATWDGSKYTFTKVP